MSIYCGINGIVRLSEPVVNAGNLYYRDGKNSKSTSIVHPHIGAVGVNSVIRKFLLPTDIIQKIIWRPIKYFVYSYQSENWTEISAAQATSYGTVTAFGNTLTVYCSEREYILEVCGTFFVVFKDGCEYAFSYLADANWNRGGETAIQSFQANLSFILSVQTGSNYPKGINDIWCFGKQIAPSSWSNSSGVYTDSDSISAIISNKWGMEIDAGNETSRWAETTVKLDSFLINGISFPVSFVL